MIEERLQFTPSSNLSMKVAFICFFSIVFFACSKKESGGQPGGNGNGNNTPVDTTSNLRVFSFNIHHANPPSRPNEVDMAAIANIIKQQQPHLVALQEVDVCTSRSGKTLHQAEELGRLTGMLAHFAKAIDYGGGEYGVAILSKFPLSNTVNYPLPVVDGSNAERRTLATAVVTMGNGKKIVFASTHLDAETDPTNRQLQVEKIVDVLKKEQYPVIVAGDFNAVAGTPVINSFDSYFTRTCVANCGFTIPASNPTRTIDFIGYASSEKFLVQEHKVIAETYASDHRPVLAIIRVK